jgi:hypothetical protein
LGSIPRRLRRITSCHVELVSASILKNLKQVQGDVTNTPQLTAGMLYFSKTPMEFWMNLVYSELQMCNPYGIDTMKNVFDMTP